uniref:Uncharacterized protein n=1 Tax=Anguilla anguilla TaxID=7936 RepID=A0A0E9UGP0_ANGAN
MALTYGFVNMYFLQTSFMNHTFFIFSLKTRQTS